MVIRLACLHRPNAADEASCADLPAVSLQVAVTPREKKGKAQSRGIGTHEVVLRARTTTLSKGVAGEQTARLHCLQRLPGLCSTHTVLDTQVAEPDRSPSNRK